MSSPGSDPFEPVRPRRRGAAAKPRSFAARLDNVLAEIRGTEWTKECQQKVEAALEALGWDPPEVLCLGLGSPVESPNAVAQLALLVSICDSLHIAHDCVSFFDPLFSEEDAQGLAAMDFCVLSENKRGTHALARPTLLFMPHCGVQLYEHILRANWGPSPARRILLLGNVLQDYATATPARKLAQETPCVSRISSYLACESISGLDAYPLAFNNMGVQYLRRDAIPDAVWTLPPMIDVEDASGEMA